LGSQPGNQKKHEKGKRKNWIEAKFQEIEDNLKTNNSKKAYQLVKDLTCIKQRHTTTIQDKAGKCPTKEQDILKRWTEYCSELYKAKVTGNSEVLNVHPATNTDDHPILREEVEAAIKALKKGKSAGVDNIQGGLVQAGGAMINALTII